MSVLYRVARPLLFGLSAEQAHHAVCAGLGAAGRTAPGRRLLTAVAGGPPPELPIEVLGLRFPNPVGIAAGFDKQGELTDAVGALGFGHVEVGTVTPEPQPGNPPPRLFRLPEDRALLNRLGFPSEGASAMRGALGKRATAAPLIGISIGKNKLTSADDAPSDYRRCYRELAELADYLAVNVSSPNTPGLRDLGVGESLGRLLEAVAEERAADAARGVRHVPVLVKVAPDLVDADLDDAVERSLALGVDGFVASNTTVSRAGLRTPGAWDREAGGLSGEPLRARALEVVRHLRERTKGEVPLIGVGGVATAADAYAMIRAGASLVQVYTGFVYGGPTLAVELVRGLEGLLRADGLGSVAEAVGADAP